MQWNERIARRLKLRDLHYLLTVVQAGSMAKATALLSVSQPVISKIIADMEHLLGVPLLDRNPRGIEPTIYGRRLLAAGYGVFDELRQGVIEIEHLSDPAAGELSIGSDEASTLGIVPAVIAKMRRTHSRCFIQVIPTNNGAEEREALSRRSVEFAIGHAFSPFSDREFETEILFEQQLFVVAGAHNPWTRKRRVKLAELMNDPWVIPSLDSTTGQLAAEVFRASRLEIPRINVVTSSFQLNHRLLEEGPFLALLPASVLGSSKQNSSLRIVPVSLPHRSSAVGITKLRNRRLSPVAEFFIETARAVARAMPSPKRTRATAKQA
ncbi:MAG TPA: LysR family transcriptional regulator [Stellaceae bacterium]|jgi:DNA-binding transcriptional LysR family regulator|nr:LysR family transcriptional regulator [Stellaceae bacterium]